MAGEWAVKTIAECASSEPYSTQIGPFGKALMADEYTESGVPVLRGVNVNRGQFHDDDFVFINDETADRLCKFESYPGDVLLVHKGTLGKIGLMPSRRKYPRYIMGNSMMRVRCDPTKLLPEYLYYWLLSADGQHYLFSRVSQVGVPQIQTPLTTLRQAALPVPPLPEQRAIAHILGTLDDKIELNRRMNETLEAMARALFKSWFVDATEVHLPQGWREGKVEELASLSRETINPMAFPDETFDHYSIPAFDEGRLPKAEKGDQIRSNKFIVPPNAVMTSKLNPRIPRVWLPNICTYRRSVASSEFLVAIPRVGVSREYLFGLFNSMAFLEVFATMVTGTSGSHQRVKPEYLLAMEVAIASSDTIEKYTEHTKLLHERVTLNLEESHTLAALRDALLPKLISGKLLAPDLAYISGSHKP